MNAPRGAWMTPEVHGVSYEGASYLGSFLTSNLQVLEVITSPAENSEHGF